MDLMTDSQARFREVKPIDAASRGAALPLAARLPRFVGLQKPPAALMRVQKIVVIGLGAVGLRIAMLLARLGVAVLWLIDHGRFDDPANAVTQEILPAEIDGRSKVGHAGRDCKLISPETRVFIFDGRVQQLAMPLWMDADAILLATDNLAAEAFVGECALQLGIPLWQGSVHGETLTAQVRALSNRHPDGPCLACQFGADEWDLAARETILSCTPRTPVQQPSQAGTVAASTMSPAFLSSLAADMTVAQWTRHVLSLGKSVTDTILTYCAYAPERTFVAELKRKADCRCNHTAMRRIVSPRPLPDCSPGQLAELAGLDQPRGATLALDGLQYVGEAVCHGSKPVRRFAAAGQGVGQCDQCGEGMSPLPSATYTAAPLRLLADDWETPLFKLGASEFRWAVVEGPQDRAVIRESTSWW